MGLRVIDYNIEYDNIDLVYTTGNKSEARSLTFRDAKKLLDMLESGSLKIPEGSIDRVIIEEIRENGGCEWLRKKVDDLVEL